MFRALVGLASSFRILGAVLLIGGLGMMFTTPAAADDDPPAPGLAPPYCPWCTQQTYPLGCQSTSGCYCGISTDCQPVGTNGCACL
jgi:hypothetical protein